MSCSKAKDGIHRRDWGCPLCRACGKPSPSDLVESMEQPWRDPIRADRESLAKDPAYYAQRASERAESRATACGAYGAGNI